MMAEARGSNPSIDWWRCPRAMLLLDRATCGTKDDH